MLTQSELTCMDISLANYHGVLQQLVEVHRGKIFEGERSSYTFVCLEVGFKYHGLHRQTI